MWHCEFEVLNLMWSNNEMNQDRLESMFYVKQDFNKQNKKYLKRKQEMLSCIKLMALSFVATLILLMDLLLSLLKFPFYIFVLRVATRIPYITRLNNWRAALSRCQVWLLWVGSLAEPVSWRSGWIPALAAGRGRLISGDQRRGSSSFWVVCGRHALLRRLYL